MKKIYLLLGVVLAMVVLTASCSSSRDAPRMSQYAKFTSVENLFNLSTGVSFDKMTEILGSKPYDMYSNQAGGYIIYEYKYKIIERQAPVGTTNSKGGEISGAEIYGRNLSTVLLFFKDGKLESFLTDKGLAQNKGSIQLIFLGNTLYTVSTDKAGKYVLEPSDLREQGIEKRLKMK